MHFFVLAIADYRDDVETMLEPYDENIEVEPYISRTKEQMIEDGKKILERIKEQQKDGKIESWQERFLECKTDEDFYNVERSDDDYDYDEDGNELTTYNPNSKWDWWQFGGRWDGELKTTKGEEVSECEIGELDYYPDKEQYKKALRFWEVVVDGESLKEGEKEEDFSGWYRKEYYAETYKDKEEYARCQSSFIPYAILDEADGWIDRDDKKFTEQGKCGSMWKYAEFVYDKLKKADPEKQVFIVDCHI